MKHLSFSSLFRKSFLTAALLGSLATAEAVIIDSSTPIPDTEVLLNYNGLDWVYAGPVGPDEFGPNMIAQPSYRASEGWRFATLAEWVLRPDWTEFIKPGFTVLDVPPVSGWDDHAKYRFASEYWSDFIHVDLNDANDGNIASGPGVGFGGSVPETWYVRNSVAATPDSGSSLVLLSLALGGMAFMGCRRKSA